MARSPRRVGDCGNEVGRTPPWSWAAAAALVWSFSFSVGERRVCVDATGVELVVLVVGVVVAVLGAARRAAGRPPDADADADPEAMARSPRRVGSGADVSPTASRSGTTTAVAW